VENLLARANTYLNKPKVAAWVFLSPSILCLLLFVFVPLFVAFGMGFFDITIFFKNIRFVGVANYRELLHDQRFWNALKNTAYFTACVVPGGTAFSLSVALYVQKNTGFRRFIRSLLYVPVVCSMTAMGIVWAMLMDPTIGIFAYWSDILGMRNFMFLKDPNWAMPLIMLMTVWKTFGLSMIIFVAALQSIPEYYYEAARIDGAGALTQFIHVTLPQIVPVLGFCIVTSTIQSFMLFDQTYIMTRGGPLFRTESMVQYIYSRAFSLSPFRLGYATAIAEVLFVIIAVVSLLMYRFFVKKEAGGMQ